MCSSDLFKLKRHKWPHPILRWTLPKSLVHLALSESFKAKSRAFTTILRHNPKKDWELPSDHKRSQLATKGLDHKRSQEHRLGSNDSRVTCSQTFTSKNLHGESKPMQQNAMARTQEVLKSFTLKFQQSNKCLWGNKRGRTKEEKHQKLQDQDLLGFPHLEAVALFDTQDIE